MTIQEMFDKAVRGLAGQDWRKSVNEDKNCVYHSPNGDRCAWGHVDPEGTEGESESIRLLACCDVGLAGELTTETLLFAVDLQREHDFGPAAEMAYRFKRLGERYGLTWPEGC